MKKEEKARMWEEGRVAAHSLLFCIIAEDSGDVDCDSEASGPQVKHLLSTNVAFRVWIHFHSLIFSLSTFIPSLSPSPCPSLLPSPTSPLPLPLSSLPFSLAFSVSVSLCFSLSLSLSLSVSLCLSLSFPLPPSSYALPSEEEVFVWSRW